ncbi:MAG: hypothetical protein OHK0021_22830 [Bryobacter sp.]
MKIRFQASTLRLRLRRSEVEQLLAEGRVAESVDFASGALVYSLELADGLEVARASFEGREICVQVPRKQAKDWASGSAVGIASPLEVPSVLIEKDFVRSAVEEQDDYDRFANPRSGRKPPAAPAEKS